MNLALPCVMTTGLNESYPIMSQNLSVSTWELLRGIGFEDDPEVMSDVRPGLSFDFGNLKLSASCVLGRHYQDVVLLTGCLETARRLSEICKEIPRTVSSREEGLAWVVSCLDKAAGGVFEPRKPTTWIAEGRAHNALLQPKK